MIRFCLRSRRSPVALLTLQDEVVVRVRSLTKRTAAQAGAGPTQAVVVLPVAVKTGRRGAALNAPHTPDDTRANMRQVPFYNEVQLEPKLFSFWTSFMNISKYITTRDSNQD